MEITIGHEIFFVQIRLISNIYDTIALQDHLKIQSAGSLAGCFICNAGIGQYNLGKVTFCGSRNNLHWKHKLRFFGQTQKCCPIDYYKKQVKQTDFDFIKTDGSPNCLEWKNLNTLCDISLRDTYQEWFNSNSYTWFHKGYENVFDGFLYYPHCDFRPMIKHARKSNEEYERNAAQAEQTKKPCNGVKGLRFENELKYADVEFDINWDPFHVLTNICSNVMNNWFGNRLNEKTKQFCKHLGMHHLLRKQVNSKKNVEEEFCQQPWSISNKVQLEVNIYFLHKLLYKKNQ
jgi:hypothetical protein